MQGILKPSYILTIMAICLGLTVGSNIASADPDHWVVTGVASNDRLNVRSAPASGAHTVGRLRNGTVVRNFGCKRNDNSRWCRISGDGVTGWVNGRFLMEAGDAGFDEPQSAGMRDVKCKKSPNECLRKAERVCGGDYRVVYSESHAGGLVDDRVPGPVTWYFLEYQCGDRGGYADFRFRGPRAHADVIYDFEDDNNNTSNSGKSVRLQDMQRYCQGEASAKFNERPQNIATLPVENIGSGYVVYGQYPPTGNNVSTFQCKFNVLRQFSRVSRN